LIKDSDLHYLQNPLPQYTVIVKQLTCCLIQGIMIMKQFSCCLIQTEATWRRWQVSVKPLASHPQLPLTLGNLWVDLTYHKLSQIIQFACVLLQ